MTPAQIIASARARMDDTTKPYLVSDAAHLLALAEAEDEAAVRASLLYDDSSPFLTFTMTEGTRAYSLDQRIWRIDAVTHTPAVGGRPREVSMAGIDALRGAHCSASSSRPQVVAHIGGELHVWPATTGTLQLAVYRRPKQPVQKMEDRLEIAAEHHSALAAWLLWRAYTNKDGEVYDSAKADLAMGEFVARFGDRPSANTQRRHNERRRVTAQYGGF